MIFWMLIFLLLTILGRRMYLIADNEWPISTGSEVRAVLGRIMAFVGFIGFLVTLLVFAWKYLP